MLADVIAPGVIYHSQRSAGTGSSLPKNASPEKSPAYCVLSVSIGIYSRVPPRRSHLHLGACTAFCKIQIHALKFGGVSDLHSVMHASVEFNCQRMYLLAALVIPNI